MKVLYQTLLACAIFITELLKIDAKEAEAFQKKGCRYCHGQLDRANYDRKPRGFGPNIQLTKMQSRRHSFCCRKCRKRQSPKSVLFLWYKWYVHPSVMLTLCQISGKESGEAIKRACTICGACEVTLRRWRRWITGFLEHPEWKLIRTKLSATFSVEKFPFSMLKELQEHTGNLQDGVINMLRNLGVLSIKLPKLEI